MELVQMVIPTQVFSERNPKAQAEIQLESNWFVAEPDRGFCQHPCDQADGFFAKEEL